jgi:dienelactone hydrolase
MRCLFAACLLASLATAHAAVVEKPIEYKVGDTTVRSTLVYDDTLPTARPGLVLVPNWMGAGEAAVAKARQIAGMQYVILVADVYGKDLRPANAEEAGKAAQGMYADRKVLRARAAEALAQLKAQAGSAPIDLDRLAAIGFCFGGATVLELARDGADLDAVVTFHGNLATDLPAAKGAVKAAVLVQNGADDGYVPAEQIAGFEKEMTAAGVDWQFVNYAGAVHCFAEPDANSGPGCQYHERSAKRAFRLMDVFLAERFAAP